MRMSASGAKPMNPALPLCSTASAFELLARQVPVIESTDGLLNGAIAISLHQLPDTDPGHVDSQIQAIADAIRKRVKGPQIQAVIAHMHHYLFDELGFVGNTENYYSATNSYLPAVLKSKQGLPITLSLICLLYTSDAADERSSVDLGGRRI